MTGRLLSRLLEGVLGFAGGLQATRMGSQIIQRPTFPNCGALRPSRLRSATPSDVLWHVPPPLAPTPELIANG